MQIRHEEHRRQDIDPFGFELSDQQGHQDPPRNRGFIHIHAGEGTSHRKGEEDGSEDEGVSPHIGEVLCRGLGSQEHHGPVLGNGFGRHVGEHRVQRTDVQIREGIGLLRRRPRDRFHDGFGRYPVILSGLHEHKGRVHEGEGAEAPQVGEGQLSEDDHHIRQIPIEGHRRDKGRFPHGMVDRGSMSSFSARPNISRVAPGIP